MVNGFACFLGVDGVCGTDLASHPVAKRVTFVRRFGGAPEGRVSDESERCGYEAQEEHSLLFHERIVRRGMRSREQIDMNSPRDFFKRQRRELLSWGVGRNAGRDFLESFNNRASNVGVRVCGGTGESRDSAASLGAKFAESFRRVQPNYTGRVRQEGNDYGNRSLGRRLEFSQCLNRGQLDTLIRASEGVRYDRHCQLSGIFEVSHRADCCDGGYPSWVHGVCDDGEQGRQRICSDTCQREGSDAGGLWRVGLIQKTTQFIKNRGCPVPKNEKSVVDSQRELFSGWFRDPEEKSIREWQLICRESVAKGCSPFSRRVVMNPFQEEWESGDSDVINSFLRLLPVGVSNVFISAKPAKPGHPIAERVPVIGRFIGRSAEQKDAEQECCGNDA